ncbi:MAG TPA: DUF4142 domain-containing protein [Dokdonella sp.]
MKTPFIKTALASALCIGFALTGAAQAQLNGNAELPRGALASADVDFLQTADAANMDQLMLGKRAASRSRDPAVHSLADTMVQSYGKADNELRLLAGAKHVDLAHNPTRKGQDEADELMDHEVSLERAYIEDVNRNTDDLIAMYETARANSDDADIRAFADEMLVALQNHKRQASDLVARKGGG